MPPFGMLLLCLINCLLHGDYVCNIILTNASGITLASREIEDCGIPPPPTSTYGKFGFYLYIIIASTIQYL